MVPQSALPSVLYAVHCSAGMEDLAELFQIGVLDRRIATCDPLEIIAPIFNILRPIIFVMSTMTLIIRLLRSLKKNTVKTGTDLL